MKKTFLIIVFTAAVLSLSSCKSETKTTTDATTQTETTTETTTETAEIAYSCPMDCEKGKTYAEKGKCPVCEMDLIASNTAETDVEADHDHDNHEGHNH